MIGSDVLSGAAVSEQPVNAARFGAGSILLTDFAFSAVGLHGIDGSGSILLDDFVFSAGGSLLIGGAASLTLEDFTVSGVMVYVPRLEGSGGVVLDDFAVSGVLMAKSAKAGRYRNKNKYKVPNIAHIDLIKTV